MKTASKRIEATTQGGSVVMLSITATRGLKKVLISSADGWHDGVTPGSHPDLYEDRNVSLDKIVATIKNIGDVEVTFSRLAMRGHTGNCLTGEASVNGKRQRVAIVITEEQGDIIDLAIKETQAEALEGKLSEFDQYELDCAIEDVTIAEKEITRNGKLLSKKEIEDKQNKYNQVVNEGAEGFVMQHMSLERYEDAKNVIEQYDFNIKY